MSIDPQYVCRDCALKAGGAWPKTVIATFHSGLCQVCKEKKSVTNVRNWGYPKFDTKSRQNESDAETSQQ